MKVVDFYPQNSRPVTEFGSRNAFISPLARLDAETQIHCIYFQPGGIVGYHPALGHQLFFVVQGKGWVRGEKGDRVWITSGQGVYWEPGEGHESGTDEGMVAIIVEAESLEKP